MKKTDDKVLCRTPTPGKKPTRIVRWKYDAIRKAILASLPKKKPGLPFADLIRKVEDRLSAEEAAKIGSLPWYLTTVKLELEVAGEIARVPDETPQRLIRM